MLLLYDENFLKLSFNSYKVYDVTPTKDQVPILMEWEVQEGIDFWSYGGPDRVTKVMVSPAVELEFLSFLRTNKIINELAIADVEATVQADKAERLHRRSKRSLADEFDFGTFWTYDEQNAYSVRLAETYPNLVAREVIGTTFEGREIVAVKISTDLDNFGSKPVIFIDSGVHAREWASHAATLYLTHQLVENATVTEELVSDVDWVIISNGNPDGYAYSWTNERLWRKNRHVINATCTGIDLNRNFGHMWQYVANSVS